MNSLASKRYDRAQAAEGTTGPLDCERERGAHQTSSGDERIFVWMVLGNRAARRARAPGPRS
jgi:hypothetical protein